ncbi:hypothetical protein TU51_12955 [Bacillus cytotoxicus]|nr:hypothetical protein TU51_12955 [Bacillus cytotoxicus]
MFDRFFASEPYEEVKAKQSLWSDEGAQIYIKRKIIENTIPPTEKMYFPRGGDKRSFWNSPLEAISTYTTKALE